MSKTSISCILIGISMFSMFSCVLLVVLENASQLRVLLLKLLKQSFYVLKRRLRSLSSNKKENLAHLLGCIEGLKGAMNAANRYCVSDYLCELESLDRSLAHLGTLTNVRRMKMRDFAFYYEWLSDLDSRFRAFPWHYVRPS